MTVEQANKTIVLGKIVLYEDIEYKLTAVIKRVHHKEKNWYYQAELKDLKANSITIADLEKVKLKEEIKQ